MPRLCRGGRCAARYPHGPPAAANKNTLDYDDVPADGVEPPQGRAERGMGCLVTYLCSTSHPQLISP